MEGERKMRKGERRRAGEREKDVMTTVVMEDTY